MLFFDNKKQKILNFLKVYKVFKSNNNYKILFFKLKFIY